MFYLNHFFKNDNYIQLSWEWESFGIGMHFYKGDTRKYFYFDILWLHFEIWV